MENKEEKQIIIGIRGEAKQAIVTAYVLIPLSLLILGLFGFLIPYGVCRGDFKNFLDGPNIMFLTFAILFFAFSVYAVINNLIHGFRNNIMLPKPVLVYDPTKDVFIGYSINKRNKQIVIPNGKITSFRGSSVWSARELTICYIDENNRSRRESFGFARNIDNSVLKAKFNQYSKRKI